MQNKDLLISLLKLCQGIKEKKSEEVKKNIDDMNEMCFEEDQINYVKEFLLNSSESEQVLLYIIENLNVIKDKACYKAIIKIRNGKNLSKKDLIDYLEMDTSMNEEHEKHVLYSMLTKKVINVGDPDLIKRAIDKLQTI